MHRIGEGMEGGQRMGRKDWDRIIFLDEVRRNEREI